MKKAFLIIMVALFSVINCNAQTISMNSNWFTGHQFSRDGINVPMGNVVNVMKENEEAFELMTSARSSYTFAQIVAGVGGFMIGWPLGTAIGGGEPNWTVAGLGAGVALVSIPIYKSSAKKAEQAIDLYNNRLYTESGSLFNPGVNLTVTQNGVGFKLTF